MPIYFDCNLTMNNILQFFGFFLVALYIFFKFTKKLLMSAILKLFENSTTGFMR